MFQKKVREFLVNIGVDVELLHKDTDLIASSILDSLGLVALITVMEEDLKISLDSTDYDINNFRTISTINTLIGKYKNE